MFQKAVIDLDEEGTTAAAVTVIENTETALPREAQFHANRPFFYIISERSTGIIFFMGQYMGSVTADIDSVTNKAETRNDNCIYDLQGRKIANSKSANSKLSKGLYIRDGKKYVY